MILYVVKRNRFHALLLFKYSVWNTWLKFRIRYRVSARSVFSNVVSEKLSAKKDDFVEIYI